jgi:hypothetical protein
MSELAAYPSIITNKLFQVEARTTTYLTNDITSGQTSFAADTTGFPSAGFITIENETIYYPSLSALQFGGICTRGYAGTAVSHVAGTMVRLSIAAATINRIIAEVIAIQTHAGTSGGAQGFINARFLGGSTEGQLNVNFLGGSTAGQLNVLSATSATNADTVDSVHGTTLAENDIVFTPNAFNLDNDNPATLSEANGTSIAPKQIYITFGNTDQADLPPIIMPRTYVNGNITVDAIVSAPTASITNQLGFKVVQAGNGAVYPPTYGSIFYLTAFTASGTTGNLVLISQAFSGASFGLTTDKLNFVRVMGGTTTNVRLHNLKLRWDKG